MLATLDLRTPVVSPLEFFVLVLALSIAFWLLGAVSGLEMLPGLSISVWRRVVSCDVEPELVFVFR